MTNRGMKGREIDFIPDGLIEEPVVFRGLSDSEVVTIGLTSIIFWIPVSVLILTLIPFVDAFFGIGVGVGMSIISVLMAGNYFQKIKRRMPDGLHIVYLKKIAQRKLSFIDYGYIEESKRWDIRRDQLVEKTQTESKD